MALASVVLACTAALLLVACDDSTPTPEALCSRATGCEQMDVLVSSEACSRQVREHLKEASPDCANCVLSLPCAGMQRVASGAVSLSRICPECAGSLSDDSCGPKHEYVLICGLSLRPAASASASASASAAPKASAAPAASGAPASSAPAAPAAGPAPAQPAAPSGH